MKNHNAFPKKELIRIMTGMGLKLVRNFKIQKWEVTDKNSNVKTFDSIREVNSYVLDLLSPVKDKHEKQVSSEGLHQEETPAPVA